MGGLKIRGVHVDIYTKAVLCDGQESTEEYLRRRLLSIMESVNWVCEEAFEGHEWVSGLTICMQEEYVFGCSVKELMFLVWCNGDSCGSRHPRG